MKIAYAAVFACFVFIWVVIGETSGPGLPPTPAEMGLTAPEAPALRPAKVVYVYPSNTVIRFQTRESLVSNDWNDVTVIYTKKPAAFYRIKIEGE